jgi:hypothetical protein
LVEEDEDAFVDGNVGEILYAEVLPPDAPDGSGLYIVPIIEHKDAGELQRACTSCASEYEAREDGKITKRAFAVPFVSVQKDIFDVEDVVKHFAAHVREALAAPPTSQ